MSDTSKAVLSICRDAAELYERVTPSLGDASLGYEVLYGPPVSTPPVLFVGYQPGGKKLEPLTFNSKLTRGIRLPSPPSQPGLPDADPR